MSTLDHSGQPGQPDQPGHPDQPPATAPAPRPSLPPPPASDRRGEPLNLSRRPFLNSRPVVRLALLLWLLGVALLLGNISLFWTYMSSSADKRAQVDRTAEERERKQAEIGRLQARLDKYDLVRLNDKIDFLNRRIDQRTFSWSLLLDRIAEVLPHDVRLKRLNPLTGDKAEQEMRQSGGSGGRRRGKVREGEVPLQITGETRSDDALLQFVDRLFQHPAFRDPNWTREDRQDEGSDVVKFDMTVTYLPGGPPQRVVVEEVTPAPGAAAIAPVPEVTPAPVPPTRTSRTLAPPASTPPGGRP